MQRDVSSCKTYNYGDVVYWDARYAEQADNCFDWFQRYSELRPFIRLYIPDLSSRVLMVGCGNSLMSEDMVKDGYEEIMNIDISSVAIDIMRRKHEHTPQLKYMQMDVRDMSFFTDGSFDSIVDKGMLDSLMCGNDARASAAGMLGEVSRLLKPGGVYLLISYGNPNGRMSHLNQPGFKWEIVLYIKPRPGFKKANGKALMRSPVEPVPLTKQGLLPSSFIMEDPESHFIYVCTKTTRS